MGPPVQGDHVVLNTAVTVTYTGVPGPAATFNALTLDQVAAPYNPATLVQTAGSLFAVTETIGLTGRSAMTQSGGTNTITTALLMGVNASPAGTVGYYTLSGGSLIAGNEIFGVSGMGQMDQSGGSHSVAGTLQMGAQGAYDLRGGTLKGGTISSGAGWLAIEGGTLIVTAGSVNVDKFYIGDTTDGAFTLPSGLTVTSNTLTVGQSGYGSLTQTGGSNHAQTLTLAAASNVAGTDTLSGGVLDVGTITSGVGTSTLNVDGGTLNITGGRVNVNAFNVGSAAGAAGSFMLTAGLAQAANNETVGNGSFTQSGGSNAISQVLQLGGSAKGSCTLAVGRMATAGSSTGTFSLDGGTLAVSSGLIAVTNFNVGNGAGRNASFALISGGTLSVPSAWTNSGMIGFGDAASTLAGGVITNSGMLQGAGAVASAIINAGTVESVAGVLALIGPIANQASGILRADAGSKLLASGGITANAGLISLAGGTVDTGSGALASAGRIIGFGVLGTGGLNNNGVATLSGGTTTVHGTVTNAAAATMEVAHSAAVFTDAVTNYGNFKATQATFAPARHAAGAHWAFKATQATFAIAGGYTEHGSFVSDPSTNTFSNLSGDTTASLSWQVGDV